MRRFHGLLLVGYRLLAEEEELIARLRTPFLV
jgi:hypothetical protein